MNDKHTDVLHITRDLYGQHPDWVTFFREALGLEGIVRQAFPRADDLAQFEKSEAYAEIQMMLARLREGDPDRPLPQEPTRVITIRLPRTLHESLRAEAHARETSMNKLCIAKLVQALEEEEAASATAVTTRETA